MQAAAGFAAFGEAIVFLSHFKDLPDPRQPGKVIYPLDEVLLVCLLAVLAGAETFVDLALFGEKKLNLLRRFRSFRDGTPSHDQLGDIFATLDAVKFQHCFVSWVAWPPGAAARRSPISATRPHHTGACWLKPGNHCLVPANSFAEYTPETN